MFLEIGMRADRNGRRDRTSKSPPSPPKKRIVDGSALLYCKVYIRTNIVPLITLSPLLNLRLLRRTFSCKAKRVTIGKIEYGAESWCSLVFPLCKNFEPRIAWRRAAGERRLTPSPDVSSNVVHLQDFVIWRDQIFNAISRTSETPFQTETRKYYEKKSPLELIINCLTRACTSCCAANFQYLHDTAIPQTTCRDLKGLIQITLHIP